MAVYLLPHQTSSLIKQSIGIRHHCMRSSLQGTMKVIPKQTKTKCPFQGFPGGSVVRGLPTNAGDMGSISGPGGSHMPQSGWLVCHNYLSLWSRACVPQLLSSCTTTTEACTPKAHAPQQEKPPQWEACAPWLESGPHSPQLEKSPHSNEDPAQPKINK